MPKLIAGREATLSMKKGELIAKVRRESQDSSHEKPMRTAGWLRIDDVWTRVFELPKVEEEREGPNFGSFDEKLRHVVTPLLEDAGFAIMDSKGRWIEEPKGNVKSVLKSWGFNDREAEEVLGLLVTHVWDLVNLPFQDEYPGDRRWNRDAARLAFVPTTDDRKMSHKHWDMIFEHSAQDWTPPLRKIIGASNTAFQRAVTICECGLRFSFSGRRIRCRTCFCFPNGVRKVRNCKMPVNLHSINRLACCSSMARGT